MSSKLKIFVDMDGTLCTQEYNYADARPKISTIIYVNKLYDAGHHITIYTARGSCTGKDWEQVTIDQLSKWGVKYHELSIGEKPTFDLLIDDRSVHPAQLRDKMGELI